MNLIPRNFFLDDFLDDFFVPRDNNLKCDIYEKDGAYHIEMDAYGFKKDDFKIECDNGYLTISVAKNEEKNDERKTYIRRERYSKEYRRSFYVGDLDSENIKASFKDGVLRITIPKKEEIETRKVIDID